MDATTRNAAHALGRWGEDRAARYLCEVDVIARRGDVVAFVEVKTRAGAGFGSPQEAITGLKRREIEAVATHFMARNALPEVDVRFDAVAIVVDRELRSLRIEHVEDAWRPGWA
jgi:putative endonuclease